MGCRWANVNTLPGLLVSLNKAPWADHPCGQLPGGPWGWHSKDPQPIWDFCTCPFWTTHIHTIPRNQVMGLGQAPEALCSWLYSSCCWASSFASLHLASCWWTLQSSCFFSFLWVACSSHSCCLIQLGVAQVASFSHLWAVTLTHMSHISRSSRVVVTLLGV